MGGEFQDTKLTSTVADLKKKYAELVDLEAWEHGHGGYSGTFAEKPQVKVMLPPAPGPYWDEEAARGHALEHNEKWGPAFAYRIADATWLIAGWCSS